MNLRSLFLFLMVVCFVSSQKGYSQCGTTVGDTVYVTNTNNVAGSFRNAINCVNDPGNSIRFIHFDIDEPGVITLTPTGAAPLPVITKDDVVIDARTEPGWFLGKVVVDGSVFSASTHGIDIQSDNVSVHGLTITGFTNSSTGGAIRLTGNNALIEENALIGNRFGIQTSSPSSFTVSNNIIGVDPVTDARNGNTVAGINILTSAGGSFTIDNNVIAHNPTGILAASSLVDVLASENSIYCNSTKGIERSGFTVGGFAISSALTNAIEGTGPNGALIEIFINDATGCDPVNPPCQGKIFLGSTTVSGGIWTFDVTPGTVQEGDDITATATIGGDNTSEFLSCLTAGCPSATIVFSEQQEACGDTPTGSVTASVSIAGNFSYEWSDGQMNAQAIDLFPGTYSVTATGDAGCMYTGIVIIDELESPVANPFGSTPLCLGDTLFLDANASGGTPAYTYNWAGPDGFMSDEANPIQPDVQLGDGGTYFVTVTDANGCESSESTVITVSEAPVFNLVVEGVSCNGAADGSIDLVPTSIITPITYAWSNSADTEDIMNLAPGPYSVTVTDGNGCIASASETVVEPAALVISTPLTMPPSTVGGSDGSFTFTLSGGAAPYAYSWTGPVNGSDNLMSAGMATINNLLAGDYNLSVTDADGCTANQAFTVNAVDCNLTITENTITDESCAGEMDGSISLTASNGTAPYNYNWLSGANSDSGAGTNITNLVAGTYAITITDQDNCTATISLEVDVTTLPDPSGTTVSSCDNGDGTAIFDLTALENTINPDPGLTILWFEDAAGTMPIANPDSYSSTGSLVYAATSNGNCQSALVSSQLIVLPEGDPACMGGECTSFAGTFSTLPTQSVCNDFSAVDIYNNDAILDANDALVFVLHTLPGDVLGTVLAVGTTPFAVFNPDNMEYDVTYYLTAIAGNSDGMDGVDLADPCLSVATGQAVIFTEMLSGVLNFIQGEEELCQGEDLFLSTNILSGLNLTYNWITPSGDTMVTDDANLLLENVQPFDAGDYYVFVQDADCLFDQTGPFTFVVLGLAPGEQIEAGMDTVICEQTYTLNASPISAGSGSWSGPAGVGISSPNTASTSVTGLANGANQFIWTVNTAECGTIGTDTVTIVVADGIQAVDDFFTLAQANDEIFMDVLKNDGLDEGVSYTLRALTQPEFGTLLTLDNGFQYFETEGFRGTVTFVYEVCYTNGSCPESCATATVTIEVLNLPYLPEGFTPNDDNRNDFLEVLGYLGGGDLTMKLKITNRWGDIVYEVDDYLTAPPWDGRLNGSGQPLPEATYYAWLEITADGVVYQQSQAIYLIH